MELRTIEWKDNSVIMIDQTKLPNELIFVEYTDYNDVAEAIRTLVVRGAPAIGVSGAFGMALAALQSSSENIEDLLSDLKKAKKILFETRPTAVNLSWALEKIMKIAEQGKTVSEIKDSVIAKAKEMAEDDININKKMGKNGVELFQNNDTIMTHCNAGALATAGHGTALGVIRSAVEAGKKISVIADETRPFLQGARLTAWEMVQENIPITLISDNMSGHLMSHGEVDAIIVGTDRVAGNGDVANKIGTYMVAVLSKRHNIPFYVACPLSTIDRSILSGSDIPIEERPIEEVTGYRDYQWAAEGVSVRNPAFDVTPADLVTGLITEKGVILSPTTEKINHLFNSN